MTEAISRKDLVTARRDMSGAPQLKGRLDELYRVYNRREFVDPDPLQFLFDYDDPRDREIVGLIASSLAFGKVSQILKSTAEVLRPMARPAAFVTRAGRQSLQRTFDGFKHRFVTGNDLADMLFGARCVIERCGSLRACFTKKLRPDHDTIVPALTGFVDELRRGSGRKRNFLLPSPSMGSACKRMNLFLRWMVRRDAVDPGGWTEVPPSKLVVPLDTHMHRIALSLGLTTRKQADLRTALEVTAAFRCIVPDDPVRYDFALTRQGIRRDIPGGAVYPFRGGRRKAATKCSNSGTARNRQRAR